MRPVAVTVVSFIYIWSISLWFVDETFFGADESIVARDLQGRPLNTTALLETEGAERFRNADGAAARGPEPVWDQIGSALGSGASSVWTVVELATGTYAFNVLERVGVHHNFVMLLKLVFPVIVAMTVVYYVTGR